jgi:hypothetical protein
MQMINAVNTVRLLHWRFALGLPAAILDHRTGARQNSKVEQDLIQFALKVASAVPRLDYHSEGSHHGTAERSVLSFPLAILFNWSTELLEVGFY